MENVDKRAIIRDYNLALTYVISELEPIHDYITHSIVDMNNYQSSDNSSVSDKKAMELTKAMQALSDHDNDTFSKSFDKFLKGYNKR